MTWNDLQISLLSLRTNESQSSLEKEKMKKISWIVCALTDVESTWDKSFDWPQGASVELWNDYFRSKWKLHDIYKIDYLTCKNHCWWIKTFIALQWPLLTWYNQFFFILTLVTYDGKNFQKRTNYRQIHSYMCALVGPETFNYIKQPELTSAWSFVISEWIWKL